MNNIKKAKNKGFVAIFVAIFVGFTAVIFTVSSSGRVWTHSKSVAEAKNLTITRFDALSCLNIARLRIFSEEENVVGEYYVSDGLCKVLDVEENSNQIQIQTSAVNQNTKIQIESTLDSETLAIISIQEI